MKIVIDITVSEVLKFFEKTRLQKPLGKAQEAFWKASVGCLLRIDWKDPNHDWPYFTLLSVDSENRRVKLKGEDFPDGSCTHDGDIFWAGVDEIDNCQVVYKESE